MYPQRRDAETIVEHKSDWPKDSIDIKSLE